MALQRLGLDVPGDIAVTGFGAFEISTISNPSLTTVNVWADQIGERTGALIGSLLNGDSTFSDDIITMLTPTLVRGESS
jgi:LacI family gluconate utilization system Gnt-I transcriptional repressor